RRANAGCAVTVRRDAIAELARVADDRSERLVGELRFARTRAMRQIAACRDHLDQIHTALALPIDHDARCLDAGRLTAPKVTMAMRRCDGLTSAQQARTQRIAACDRVAHGKLEEATAAEIARGRDAGAHHRFGTIAHGRELVLVAAAGLCLGFEYGRIETHVH